MGDFYRLKSITSNNYQVYEYANEDEAVLLSSYLKHKFHVLALVLKYEDLMQMHAMNLT